MRIRTLILLIPLIAACRGDPWQLEEQTVLVPPPVYFAWFREVAACTGRESEATPERFSRIRWYSALAIHDGAQRKALGLWTRPHRVAIKADRLNSDDVVKHELVHDLLQDAAHESSYFTRCVD